MDNAVASDVLHAVFVYFQRFAAVADFPVRSEDDLAHVYGICDEDLDEAILELAATVGAEQPTTESVRHFPSVRSVGDVVRLIAAHLSKTAIPGRHVVRP